MTPDTRGRSPHLLAGPVFGPLRGLWGTMLAGISPSLWSAGLASPRAAGSGCSGVPPWPGPTRQVSVLSRPWAGRAAGVSQSRSRWLSGRPGLQLSREPHLHGKSGTSLARLRAQGSPLFWLPPRRLGPHSRAGRSPNPATSLAREMALASDWPGPPFPLCSRCFYPMLLGAQTTVLRGSHPCALSQTPRRWGGEQGHRGRLSGRKRLGAVG